VRFDAGEAEAHHRLTHQLGDAAAIALGVHEGEAVEAIDAAADDAGDLAVGHAIVGVEGREEHGALDAGRAGACEIAIERRGGVPRSGQTVAGAGVAVAVDDH
jgi:hypothetical protein